jgi:hypothetical protein
LLVCEVLVLEVLERHRIHQSLQGEELVLEEYILAFCLDNQMKILDSNFNLINIRRNVF